MSETRRAGFRFSVSDGVAIAIGGLLTALALAWLPEVAPLAGLVLGHFFLFCNVFRIRRSYELIWTAVFMTQVLVALFAFGLLDWGLVLTIQLPLTAILIGLELRSPRYHGIAARRINPDLDEWLAGKMS